MRATIAGSSGDGWTTCAQGHRHWGRYGAAGLLVVSSDEKVLLQLRSERTHTGNTWSVPGGARNSWESPLDAALREAGEEIGVAARDVEPFAEFVDDHGGWEYTTIAAELVRPFPVVLNFESRETRWVPITEVPHLALHPGFAASWDGVRQAMRSADPRRDMT